MQKILGLLACLLLLSPAVFAAEETGTSEAEEESSAPAWLKGPPALAATIGLPKHLFSLGAVGATNDNKKNIDYSPAQATDLTLGAAYGALQLAWTFPLPQSAGDRSTYGKSRYYDFKVEFGRERFATSVFYQSFSGFYTDLNGNTGNFARVGSGSAEARPSDSPGASALDSQPQDILRRPDIRTRHYGAIGWYAFALSGQDFEAFQISFDSLPGKPHPGFGLDLVTDVFLDRALVQGSSPLVPEKKASLFGQGAKLTGVDFISAGAGLGLVSSYVFASASFYLDGLFLYGGGAQRQRAQFTDDFRWANAYADNVNLRMGANYRGEKGQAGLHFWVNTLGSRVSDLRFNSSNMAIELSYQRTI